MTLANVKETHDKIQDQNLGNEESRIQNFKQPS